MKSESDKKSRNEKVDVIRGVAMLMVVLQHTIAGCTVEYENTFLFKIIWTLQMPLFFIISGYVTRYSRPIDSFSGLCRFVRKRTLAYILPWAVWTIAVRGWLFGQHNFLDFGYLLWHMDNGYWFLVSLWTIVVLFGLSDYLSNKISFKSIHANILLHLGFMTTGALTLVAVGYFAGLSFLCIKLTLYYIPLYLFGYIFGQYQEYLTSRTKWNIISQYVASLAFVVWMYTMLHYSFYGTEMGLKTIVLRYISSSAASVFAIYLITNTKWGGYLLWPENIHSKSTSYIICC